MARASVPLASAQIGSAPAPCVLRKSPLVPAASLALVVALRKLMSPCVVFGDSASKPAAAVTAAVPPFAIGTAPLINDAAAVIFVVVWAAISESPTELAAISEASTWSAAMCAFNTTSEASCPDPVICTPCAADGIDYRSMFSVSKNDTRGVPDAAMIVQRSSIASLPSVIVLMAMLPPAPIRWS